MSRPCLHHELARRPARSAPVLAGRLGGPARAAERAEDLHRRFVQQPDTSSASFEQKLRQQLQGAPPATFQAMGELLFLHLLIASDIGGASKRSTIQVVLSWSPEPVSQMLLRVAR